MRNSVSLGGNTRVLLVSGSNMSGKSTLLRTVGINAVLALAGAPVRASALTLSPGAPEGAGSAAADTIKLAARYNLARMLERSDFKQRFDAGKGNRGVSWAIPGATYQTLAPARRRIPASG